MMLVCTDGRPSDQDQLSFRRRALRDAVICIGWLKLVSVIYYVVLYFLVHSNSEGHMSKVLQTMTLITIIPQVLLGILLFLGALEKKPLALELSLWLCLIVASYNTVLGVMGGIYFIRTGHYTMHFLLALLFGMLALSLFTIICHDIIIIFSLKRMLIFRPPTETTTDKA